jgi:hypothetical protein
MPVLNIQEEDQSAEPSQNITLNNHQVGMVLLPDTLSIDPGLESLQQKYAFHSDWASK